MFMTVLTFPLRLAFVIIALCGLATVTGCSRTPADDSAEAGFARDMATHHAQAVEMAFIIRDVTTHPDLRALAADIIVTQSAQRGMFMAWLQMWGLPQASAGPRMAWMDSAGSPAHSHDASGHTAPGMPLMAGMASDGEIQTLRQAAGRDAEVLFLQLMIRHHEGGVIMARALLSRSNYDIVARLARSIDEGQTGEIATMVAMLAERSGIALPSLLN